MRWPKTGRLLEHSPISLLQLGWIIFGLGVVWDVLYHGIVLLTNVSVSPAQDFVGSLGHVVTFGGTALIIFAILRRQKR